jgi:lysophospholipase L1-like esterase
MNAINNIPSKGTFGAAVEQMNQNFGLIVTAINELDYKTTRSKGILNYGTNPATAFPNAVSGDWCMILSEGNVFPATIKTYNGSTWSGSGTWNPEGLDLTGYAKTTDMNTAIVNSLAQATARMGYGECTVSGTALTVSIPNFILPTSGGIIHIKMSAAGTGASTLNINSTGAKTLWYNGAAVSAQNTWEAGEIISVFYDGTRFMASNSQGGGGKAEKISFDNSNSWIQSDNVQEALDDVASIMGEGSQESDLDIEDQFGNRLARFMNGHVKTKYFDSATDVPTSSGDTQTGDLEITDPSNNVLMRLYDGHIKTKEFDSSAIEKKNISSNLWQIINGTHLADVFKKVCCIGDSLTAGFTKIGGVDIGSAAARPLGNNWPAYMENLTGGNQYDNIAIGSSTTHHWRYEDGPQSEYKPDLDLANDSTYEAYIIALGVNDERTNVTVGTISDIASNKSSNADTFCGNYDYIVRQLIEWNSKAHIFCLTIPLSEGSKAVQYNAIINEIGNLYPNKVHVISLEREDVDLSWIAVNFANGHYCPIVYNYFASIIYRRISDTIWNNNTIFRETPYN